MNIVMITFFVCAIVMTGDYLNDKLIRHFEKNKEAAGVIGEEKYTEKVLASEAATESEAEMETAIQQITGTETAEPVGYEYFNDALFIGDSRTVGLMEYGNIQNAAFLRILT